MQRLDNPLRKEIKISNVVSTADLKQKIDIASFNSYKFLSANLNHYRCGYIKDNTMVGRVSAFASGKLISVGTKSLTTSRYLKHIGDKYHPNFEKLVSDFDNFLKLRKQSLNDDEKKIIHLFLTHRGFFGLMSLDVLEKLRKQQKGTHRLDALEIFCNKMGMVATLCLFGRSHNSELKKFISKIPSLSFKDVKEIFDEVNELFVEDGPKIDSNMESMISELQKKPTTPPGGINLIEYIQFGTKFFPSFLAFFLMPETTLKKLSLLWDQYDGFNLGVKMTLPHSSRK